MTCLFKYLLPILCLTHATAYTQSEPYRVSQALSIVAPDSTLRISSHEMLGSILIGVNQAPVVHITEPANHAHYAMGIQFFVQTSVYDPDGIIDRVEFYNYDTLLDTDATAPYELKWLFLKPGIYQVTARTFDNTGSFTNSDPVNIEIVAPYLNIVTPGSEQNFTEYATISITVDAWIHSLYNIPWVEFYDNDVLVATDEYAPYEHYIPNPSIGEHIIRVKVLSNYITSSTSEAVTVMVRPNAATAITTFSTSLCAGSSDVIFTVPEATGTTYEWEYSGTGFTITEGASSHEITGGFSTTSTSGDIIVYAVKHGVRSLPLSSSITISQPPNPVGPIVGDGTPLRNSEGNVYSVELNGATSVEWHFDGMGALFTRGGNDTRINFSEDATSGTLSAWSSNVCGNGEPSSLFLNFDEVVTGNETVDPTSIYVSPNPSSGIFTVTIPEPFQTNSITILDMQCRVVATYVAIMYEQLDVSHLAKGQYILRIESTDHTWTRKIVIR